jgi:hypothetical protein
MPEQLENRMLVIVWVQLAMLMVPPLILVGKLLWEDLLETYSQAADRWWMWEEPAHA